MENSYLTSCYQVGYDFFTNILYHIDYQSIGIQFFYLMQQGRLFKIIFRLIYDN